MDFPLTDEQVVALGAAMGNDHLAIEAMAGTGKTSTLAVIAENKQQFRDRGHYLAFNNAIVRDAEKVFPSNVTCSTVHSLAYRAGGNQFQHRFKADRMRSRDIARRLHLTPIVIETKFGTKRLAAGFLAGMVMKGVRRFCQTADEEPGPEHVPTPTTLESSPELIEAWRQVRQTLGPALGAAWDDLQNPRGDLPYDQSAYLKMWQMGRPRIACDFLLVDEAQDLNGVMLSIADYQRDHAQLIAVGDSRQQIYEWNGSLNAMAELDVDTRVWLTRSFRFGPEIAAVANSPLSWLGDARVKGCGKPGVVGRLDYPDCILSRTNAEAVRGALHELAAGGAPHIVGGADDVVSFAKGALELQSGQQSWHPDLACFSSWPEVRAYVENDELGYDIKLLVSLIDEFGAQVIIDTLANMPNEDRASVVLSTAHKSKGRQFYAVQIAGDFPDPDDDISDEELRLQYVAVTRARTSLDVCATPWMAAVPA